MVQNNTLLETTPKSKLLFRFMSDVGLPNQKGCTEWLGFQMPNGYGQTPFTIDNTRYAHRISWILNYGKIPKDLHVCHKCDNPICVNPHHLFIGTNHQNILDCKAKGRNTKGKHKTHCIRGHDLSIHGKFKPDGTRYCFICNHKLYEKENTQCRNP